MATLTVTLDGTLVTQPEVLKHLGLEPGQTLAIDLLPNGHIAPATDMGPKRTGTWDDVFGCLQGKTDVVLTIEEINEAIAAGWAGER